MVAAWMDGDDEEDDEDEVVEEVEEENDKSSACIIITCERSEQSQYKIETYHAGHVVQLPQIVQKCGLQAS